MSSKSGGRKKSQTGKLTIADNRKATFQYEIEDTFEAGIVLTGSEIKKALDRIKLILRDLMLVLRMERFF